MLRRIWIAYKLELAKAIRLKFSYAGPLLVILAVVATAVVNAPDKDGLNDYGYVAHATGIALDMLGLVLVLTYCAGLVSSELGAGTIRTVLVRPIRRTEFLAAKVLLGMTYAVLITATAAVFSWGVALVFGDLSGVSYGGEVIYTAGRMRNAYLMGMLLMLAPLFAAVNYAIMISTVTRNTAAAIGSALGIWIALDIVKHPLGIAPYLFTSYFETPWAVFTGYCDVLEVSWFPDARNCLLASAVSTGVFAAVASYVITNRNLQT